MDVMTKADIAIAHPLDPLTPAEISRAAEIVRAAPIFRDGVKFETIELKYPEKSFVRAWRSGEAFQRRAFLCIYDTANGEVRECLVDLDADELVASEVIPNARPAVMVDEITVAVTKGDGEG